jgi:hypothetical protein
MIELPPFAALKPSEPSEGEPVALPLQATSLQFLQSIYRDPAQPLGVRMRAAALAIAYEHPKLSVSVTGVAGFGNAMERLMQAKGMQPIIDAGPKADGV